MDIELSKGIVVGVNPAEQSNEWLVNAAQEIAEVAEARGLELAFAAGTVAVESAEQSEGREASATPETATITETLDIRE